ncbi:hypothetical protein MPTK1_2g14490 [Marchantia polymorpha subsp. ruderalis]
MEYLPRDASTYGVSNSAPSSYFPTAAAGFGGPSPAGSMNSPPSAGAIGGGCPSPTSFYSRPAAGGYGAPSPAGTEPYGGGSMPPPSYSPPTTSDSNSPPGAGNYGEGSRVHYVGVSLSAAIGAAAATNAGVASLIKTLPLIAPTFYRGKTTSEFLQAWDPILFPSALGTSDEWHDRRLGAFNFPREFHLDAIPLTGPASRLRSPSRVTDHPFFVWCLQLI